VSGTDFVGANATSSSLGLADSYTLLLLTSCAHYPNGTTSCARPTIGFNFNHGTDLKLDSTSLSDIFPQTLLDAQTAYRRVSPFIADAYIISALLLVTAPIAGALASRPASILAVIFSSLATLFLLGAGIASTVVFRNLNTQLNAAYSSSGIISTTGSKPVIFGFLAFALSFLNTIIFLLRRPQKRGRAVVRNIGTEYPGGKSGFDGEGSEPKPGLWKRVPTWSAHKYVQVEKQPVLVKSNLASHQEPVVVTSPSGRRSRADAEDDWTVEDEYATGGRGVGIPMMGLAGNKRQTDSNTAYEPYKNAGGR
jgi:hypothetical protein